MDDTNDFSLSWPSLGEHFNGINKGLEKVFLVGIVHQVEKFLKVFQEIVNAFFRIFHGLCAFQLLG